MTVVSLREYLFVIVGSVVLSLAVTAVLFSWARRARTLITIALATALGIILWNTLLNVTNATFLNVDSPLLGLSAQDVGSGVGAFLVTALALRFVVDRNTATGRVLALSTVVGLVTILVDLFGYRQSFGHEYLGRHLLEVVGTDVIELARLLERIRKAGTGIQVA